MGFVLLSFWRQLESESTIKIRSVSTRITGYSLWARAHDSDGRTDSQSKVSKSGQGRRGIRKRICFDYFSGSMRVETIQDAINKLVACLLKVLARVRGGREDFHNREIEELAQSILDYARMLPQPRPEKGVQVEVDELAFRLRETRQTIIEVLHLLESRERAARTELKGVWYLNLGLRYACNRAVEGEASGPHHTLLPADRRRSS
jgi:hypothetical protein